MVKCISWDKIPGSSVAIEGISHTRTHDMPPEEQFEDEKLEEKKTRAYSKVIGYVKRKE